jgi:hypothetical protein
MQTLISKSPRVPNQQEKIKHYQESEKWHLYTGSTVREDSDPQVKVITRGEAERQREKAVLDRTLDARDGAQPVQCYHHSLEQPLTKAWYGL